MLQSRTTPVSRSVGVKIRLENHSRLPISGSEDQAMLQSRTTPVSRSVGVKIRLCYSREPLPSPDQWESRSGYATVENHSRLPISGSEDQAMLQSRTTPVSRSVGVKIRLLRVHRLMCHYKGGRYAWFMRRQMLLGKHRTFGSSLARQQNKTLMHH